MDNLLTLALSDNTLETPFRDLAVSREAAVDVEKALDDMYKALKESYLNVRDKKACIAHTYREDEETDERNQH